MFTQEEQNKVTLESEINLDELDQKILFQFSVPKVAAYVLNYLRIPKTTFYRRLKKMVRKGIIVKLDEGAFCRYAIAPRLKKSMEMELVVWNSSSTFETTNDFPSETKPKKEKDYSKKKATKTPSKRGTRYDITSKKLSFEEQLKRFDLNHIRSHGYLYSIEILKAPSNYYEILDNEGNWLEPHDGMNNWRWYRGVKRLDNIDSILRFYPNRITIQILQIFGPNVFVNDSIADTIITELIAEMEERYKLTLGKRNLIDKWDKGKAHLKSSHHALPFHPMALIAVELNHHTKTDRFELDASPGVGELDAIHKNFSSVDLDKYIHDLTDQAKNDYWVMDAKREIQTTNEIQREIVNKLPAIFTGQLTNAQMSIGALEQSGRVLEYLRNLNLEKHFLPTTLQQRILKIVGKNPGLTRKQISQKFQIKIGSVNGTIARLLVRKKVLVRNHQIFVGKND